MIQMLEAIAGVLEVLGRILAEILAFASRALLLGAVLLVLYGVFLVIRRRTP